MPNRREFLATIGGVALGASAFARIRTLQAEDAARQLASVGIQLYTVRDLMKKDLEGTLAKLGQIGYREVEFAGYFGRTPSQIRSALRGSHLMSPSSHIPFPANDDAWARALDDAKAIGHAWVVIPWIDEKSRTTDDDWSRIADRLNGLAAQAKAKGLRFAYHNHDFEFVTVGSGTALEHLIEKTDPALVDFEMDIYWIVKGGGDPLDMITRYPHRFPLLHVKDATAAPERKIVDVGSGTIDFKSIFSRSKDSGMQHIFVEHDHPGDALASARASYKHLSALKFN